MRDLWITHKDLEKRVAERTVDLKWSLAGTVRHASPRATSVGSDLHDRERQSESTTVEGAAGAAHFSGTVDEER
ncbi:MAG: hypothetical protein ACJAXA_001948 [Candidatus Aldehydirespiratoraceae bacterium]|jgi:hypothetical protein